jgi:hypothetical protein
MFDPVGTDLCRVSIANSSFLPISQGIEPNEENVMHIAGSNNHRQQSVAAQGPRQLERDLHNANDHEHTMKLILIGVAFSLLVLACPTHASAQQATSTDKTEQSQKQTAETSFMAENKAAMNKMMMDMAVKPSGNVDADFTAMMIPHHQGAVDMAEAELHYGHNLELRRIARNIIAGQRQQIVAMKAALRQQPSKTTSSTTKSGHAS